MLADKETEIAKRNGEAERLICSLQTEKQEVPVLKNKLQTEIKQYKDQIGYTEQMINALKVDSDKLKAEAEKLAEDTKKFLASRELVANENKNFKIRDRDLREKESTLEDRENALNRQEKEIDKKIAILKKARKE